MATSVRNKGWLVSLSGMVETPRLQAKKRFRLSQSDLSFRRTPESSAAAGRFASLIKEETLSL